MRADCMRKLFACLNDLGISADRPVRHRWATCHLGRSVTTFGSLTATEIGDLIIRAEYEISPPPEPDESRGLLDQLWLEIFAASPDGMDPEDDISLTLGVDPNTATAEDLRAYLALMGT